MEIIDRTIEFNGHHLFTGGINSTCYLCGLTPHLQTTKEEYETCTRRNMWIFMEKEKGTQFIKFLNKQGVIKKVIKPNDNKEVKR